mmetsp:Transcript_8660/g.26640  ORF Transcript_8660/g.26640 Transcript_8660/m.26640 type:complete len:479 (+) Transcript_8660:89-1525(+)
MQASPAKPTKQVLASPDTIYTQALDFPDDLLLPSRSLPRPAGIAPAAVLTSNLAALLFALALLVPPMSEASYTALAGALALSPVAASLLGGPAVRMCSANMTLLLLIDCVLAAIASATVLPLIPSALHASYSLAKHKAVELAVLAGPHIPHLAQLAPVAIAGFAAQLVDGSLGMGYGLTSSTVLSASGLSPATASASVHLAQLGTTFVSGLAHHRHGNVDTDAMLLLSPAGGAGAFFGALLLSSVPVGAAKLVSGGLLFLLGLTVTLRFMLLRHDEPPNDERVQTCTAGGSKGARSTSASKPRRQLVPLGFLGGFVDATGGGGWGPVATSSLLTDGQLSPCRVIGTTSASEFFVTVAAVCGFGISSLLASFDASPSGSTSEHSARLDMVAALLLGGVVAAPMAPFLTAALCPRVLGVTVGGLISFTNLKSVLAVGFADVVPRDISRGAHTAFLLGWAGLVATVVHGERSRSRIRAGNA